MDAPGTTAGPGAYAGPRRRPLQLCGAWRGAVSPPRRGWQVTGQRGVPAGISIQALKRGPEKYAPEHCPGNLPAPVHGRGRGKGRCVPFGTDTPPVDRSGPMCPIGTLASDCRQGGKPAMASNLAYNRPGSLCARCSTRTVSKCGRVAPVHLMQRRGAPRVRNSQPKRRPRLRSSAVPGDSARGQGGRRQRAVRHDDRGERIGGPSVPRRTSRGIPRSSWRRPSDSQMRSARSTCPVPRS